MSFFKQLWLTVIVMTLVVFCGSFLLSVLTAKNFLIQQLYLKNVDNAASLALSISQLPDKDPVLVELMISSQFDIGHYQEITLTGPDQRVLVQRRYTGGDPEAPSWFVRIFPLDTPPGIAQVQDGWKQYGTLQVISHSRFARRELWKSTRDLVIWFLMIGAGTGVLGTLVLRRIAGALNHVAGQAQALTERRFITVPEPKTPELRTMVRAMNDMVERLKLMFAQEASRLESLRRRVNHDSVTGLPNREFFMSHLQKSIKGEESADSGSLALIRMKNMDDAICRLGHDCPDRILLEDGEAGARVRCAGQGHACTNRILLEVAGILKKTCDGGNGWIPARIRPLDFALFAPHAENSSALAEQLFRDISGHIIAVYAGAENLFNVGAACFQRNDDIGNLLAAADNALATAEYKGKNTRDIFEQACALSPVSSETWHGRIAGALSAKRIKLARFPVRAFSGAVLHLESAARLQSEPDGPWLCAGDFMHMATRFRLVIPLDLQVIHLALDALASEEVAIAVNLSEITVSSWQARSQLLAVLKQHRERCHRLWLEIPETGAFQEMEALQDFCHRLKGLGCHIGIEHFGLRFGEIAKLTDLALDYLKVDAGFIREIHLNPGNQEFLKGLCQMAHGIGITVIAEGVQSAAELSALSGLGFDGATGPGVSMEALKK
jgi:EAL domain-containing protein (putative c-di-GMP-specific phosphodiesterase class I)/GGDEF domain-containing protein